MVMKTELLQKTEKPWGYELLFAHTAKYAGKILFIKAGHRLSLQYHNVKDETLFVQQGRVEITTQNGELLEHSLLPGDRIRIPVRTRHRVTAIENSIIFEVSTPELYDVVRLEDDYGRNT